MDDHGLNELTEAPLAQTEHELELEEEGDEEEWQDFSSQVAAGSSLGCAESTFGSSGYSSLAGTQDNLRSVAGWLIAWFAVGESLVIVNCPRIRSIV